MEDHPARDPFARVRIGAGDSMCDKTATPEYSALEGFQDLYRKIMLHINNH